MPEKTVKEQIDEALGGVIEKLTGTIDAKLKPISDQHTELSKNLGVIASTMAADKKAAEEAAKNAGEGKGEKKEGASGTAAPLTIDAVQKLLDDRDAARAASSKKNEARAAVIASKLKDVPVEFHASLPDSDDPTVLTAAADKIVARVNEVIKVRTGDLGGNKDGGTPPGSGAPKTLDLAASGALTGGQAKLATAIKGELAALNGAGK